MALPGRSPADAFGKGRLITTGLSICLWCRTPRTRLPARAARCLRSRCRTWEPPGAHPVQRRRDPMGVLGYRYRPPAPALAAPARQDFSYERTRCSCLNANPSRPAGRRLAASARTPAGAASAMPPPRPIYGQCCEAPHIGEDLPTRGGTPFVGCATAAESGRSGAGAPPVLRRWRHHLPGKSAGGRDYDQRPVRGADREGSRVILLENAQDVGDLFAVTRAGPAPADHDPLADIGGCEADLEPVAHAGHLFPGWAARRRVPGRGPGAWIVAGLAAAGSGGRLRAGDGAMMPL